MFANPRSVQIAIAASACLLHGCPFPAKCLHRSHVHNSYRQAKRMRLLVGQGERFPDLFCRAWSKWPRSAKQPGDPPKAKHSWFQPIEKCMNVMFLRVIESDGSLEVGQRGDQLSEKEQRISLRQVSFHQKTRVLHTLG